MGRLSKFFAVFFLLPHVTIAESFNSLPADVQGTLTALKDAIRKDIPQGEIPGLSTEDKIKVEKGQMKAPKPILTSEIEAKLLGAHQLLESLYLQVAPAEIRAESRPLKAWWDQSVPENLQQLAGQSPVSSRVLLMAKQAGVAPPIEKTSAIENLPDLTVLQKLQNDGDRIAVLSFLNGIHRKIAQDYGVYVQEGPKTPYELVQPLRAHYMALQWEMEAATSYIRLKQAPEPIAETAPLTRSENVLAWAKCHWIALAVVGGVAGVATGYEVGYKPIADRIAQFRGADKFTTPKKVTFFTATELDQEADFLFQKLENRELTGEQRGAFLNRLKEMAFLKFGWSRRTVDRVTAMVQDREDLLRFFLPAISHSIRGETQVPFEQLAKIISGNFTKDERITASYLVRSESENPHGRVVELADKLLQTMMREERPTPRVRPLSREAEREESKVRQQYDIEQERWISAASHLLGTAKGWDKQSGEETKRVRNLLDQNFRDCIQSKRLSDWSWMSKAYRGSLKQKVEQMMKDHPDLAHEILLNSPEKGRRLVMLTYGKERLELSEFLRDKKQKLQAR